MEPETKELGLRIEKMMTLDYTCFMHERSGRIVLRVPELKIVAYGTDVESAHRSLQEEKKRLFERHLETGCVGDLPTPTRSGRGGSPPAKNDMWLFVQKTVVATLIVSVILGSGLAIAGYYAVSGLDRTFVAIAKRTLATLASRAEGLSESSKEEARRNIEVIVRELKPLVGELRPLFEGNEEQEAPRSDAAQ